MKVEIRESHFEPWQDAQAYQQQRAVLGKYGATSMFVGTMRDKNQGDEVTSMQLEHYPEMTQKHLEQIAQHALDNFEILDVMMLHRVGQVLPGDPIVCVVVWSEHRAAAYDANRFIMEDLKSKTPIWKKEKLKGEQRWVEKNTPG